MKEIEKEGSKSTKISSIQIKDILTDLLNESLIQVEKCGNLNLYWSFKFNEAKNASNNYERLKSDLEKKTSLKEQLKKSIEAAKLERNEIFIFEENGVEKKKNRDEMLNEIKQLDILNKNLTKELDVFKENESILNVKTKAQELMKAIDFYTESIETLIHYFTKVEFCPVNEKSLRSEFGIPEEFEDIPLLF